MEIETFKGYFGFWRAKIEGNSLEVEMRIWRLVLYRRSCQLSEVVVLDAGWQGDGGKAFYLCFHRITAFHKEKQIGVPFQAFPTPASQRLMQMIQQKAISAKTTERYTELLETGTLSR